MKDVMMVVGAGQIGMAIARRVGYGKKIVLGNKKWENAQAIAGIMCDAGFDVTAVKTDISSRDSIRNLTAEAQKYGEIRACSGDTDIFLYPGREFKAIDGLITNFHLPESTLIMLVSAFYGYEKTMAAYKTAVEEKYRFFSFGDAMLIL